jgi:hypothetical protein
LFYFTIIRNSSCNINSQFKSCVNHSTWTETISAYFSVVDSKCTFNIICRQYIIWQAFSRNLQELLLDWVWSRTLGPMASTLTIIPPRTTSQRLRLQAFPLNVASSRQPESSAKFSESLVTADEKIVWMYTRTPRWLWAIIQEPSGGCQHVTVASFGENTTYVWCVLSHADSYLNHYLARRMDGQRPYLEDKPQTQRYNANFTPHQAWTATHTTCINLATSLQQNTKPELVLNHQHETPVETNLHMNVISISACFKINSCECICFWSFYSDSQWRLFYNCSSPTIN